MWPVDFHCKEQVMQILYGFFLLAFVGFRTIEWLVVWRSWDVIVQYFILYYYRHVMFLYRTCEPQIVSIFVFTMNE